MDRLISDEERIRRAEDVLERRRNTDLRISSESFIKEQSGSKIKKMLIQIFVCLLIYCGIYYTKNSQNEGFKNFLGNINSVLEYDVDFKSIYESVCAKIDELNLNIPKEENQVNEEETNDINNAQNSQEENNQGEKSQEENNQDESNQDKNDGQEGTDEQVENSTNMGIGGGSEESSVQENTVLSDEEQIEVDENYIKENFSLINPLTEGVVTSKFGNRESSAIVSANHKGIDLGATTGSIIIAASEGRVVEASSEGDFGIHLKIEKDGVIFIYAHCSELLVSKGDTITQGQQIAKVGSTGKATGPHLHFEIRRDGRAVNPEYLLDF